MSYTREQLETIENMRADFDDAINHHEFHDARAIIDNMCELGYEGEATILHHEYNRAEQAYLETPAGALEYAELRRPEYPNE